jgi:hypothetical protein
MSRVITAMVVIRFDEGGEISYHIADPDGSVAVVVVDERCPGDRCYEMTLREDALDVAALAPMPWGHSCDERHAQTVARVLGGPGNIKLVEPDQ